MGEVDAGPKRQQGELEVVLLGVAEPLVCFPIDPLTARKLSVSIWKDRVDFS